MSFSNRAAFFVCVVIAVASVRSLAAQPVRLTQDGAFKFGPTFSAGGEEILYSLHDIPNRVTLMRLHLSDGHQEIVDKTLKSHQLDPVESADRRFLAFCLSSSSPQTVLIVRDRKEKTESRFTPTGARSTARGPRIAPDNQRVIFTVSQPGGQQIASVDTKCGDYRQLTDSPSTNCWPDISPDGKQIAFSSSRSGSFNIYVMNVDGSNERQVTNNPLRNMRPAWSPDGKRIAFTSGRDGNHEIYVCNADGTSLRRVTHHPDRDDYPIWHPDGKRLVMVSQRKGDTDLYLFELQ
jgi:Tol biopolymer transport system component